MGTHVAGAGAELDSFVEEAKHVLGGRYEYVESAFIAGGAFGSVYRGTDTQTGDNVAIKVISKRMPEETLEREISIMQALQLIDHPNLCKLHYVHGHGVSTERSVCLVLDLLEGKDLFERA